ncbi:ABC transporter substrate-binding protein [Paenibacillus lignilyticus]|uniref:Sugar ABC transporter substrate-binding protein n=1 Tax=Paenibacillus lignilyticus TaxID=1172615 RepID=A0ABS5CHQ9_9BACL|nr:sugar ABC transporter substrate-binding protein [Paenibacillus lignilyticus]MBP3965380.1 sugar ABC transporter substrate-binding protein [Paenibacillus lignilyticus]
MGVHPTRKLRPFVFAFMMLTVAAGCSVKNNSNSKDAVLLIEPVQANTPSEKVTLKMMESLTNPQRTGILKEQLAAFEAENPLIHVELISPPFDQADETIRTMLAAKQDLDVIEVRDVNIADYVSKQYIDPLDTYAANWKDFSTVADIPLNVGSVEGQMYFLANGLYERQLYYRKDWFDSRELTPPTTWQELYETAVKLTDRSKNRYGFSFRGAKGANSIFDTMIRTYNGDQMDQDDGAFRKDGASAYSSPEAEQALSLFALLYKNASPEESLYFGFEEQVNAFTSGQTAMLLQDSDVIQTLQAKMAPGTWATAPMPAGPSGKALITVGAAGWGIPAQSLHKEEAWKLIAYLSSPERNISFGKRYGLVPIHTTAAVDPFFMTGPYQPLIEMTNDPDTYMYYRLPIQYPSYLEWEKRSTKAEQRMLLGEATVKETLKAWDAFWKEQKALMHR